jgi:hypothetical protein
VTTVRIATVDLRDVEETGPGDRPSLDERTTLLQPQIARGCAGTGQRA